jgi:rSAM/selenodomain-associated transferase 2
MCTLPISPSLSIIVPMLDERPALPRLLEDLQSHREEGCEVLIVDGGSRDGSSELARRAGFTVASSAPGRARQMNTGAQLARGELLLFLHADTRLPSRADRLVREVLSNAARTWGFFQVRIDGGSPVLRIVAFLMNCRSRLTGIATGDQAIFVRRSVFQRIEGYPEQPLMEDIELSKRLKRTARPICVRARATTSGRRWESRGILRAIVLMWGIRLAYWLGASPETLARRYR